MDYEIVKVILGLIISCYLTFALTACGVQMGTNSYWERQDRLIREVLKTNRDRLTVVDRAGRRV